MFKKSSLVLAVAIVFVLFGCGKNEQVRLSSSDPLSGSGKFFNLKFKEQASTGFIWDYEMTDDCLDMIEKNEDAGENIAQAPGMVGAPTDVTYTFTANESGKTTLTFTYHRPFEGGEHAYDIEYDFLIDANFDITCTDRRIINVDYEAEVSEIPYPFFYSES